MIPRSLILPWDGKKNNLERISASAVPRSYRLVIIEVFLFEILCSRRRGKKRQHQ
jgi:hypothetical protein